MARAIGMRCYGEDEFRERGKVTGGEQTRRKEKRRWRVLLFIEEEGASSFASSLTRSPRSQKCVTARESSEDIGGKQLRGADGKQEVASGFKLIF